MTRLCNSIHRFKVAATVIAAICGLLSIPAVNSLASKRASHKISKVTIVLRSGATRQIVAFKADAPVKQSPNSAVLVGKLTVRYETKGPDAFREEILRGGLIKNLKLNFYGSAGSHSKPALIGSISYSNAKMSSFKSGGGVGQSKPGKMFASVEFLYNSVSARMLESGAAPGSWVDMSAAK